MSEAFNILQMISGPVKPEELKDISDLQYSKPQPANTPEHVHNTTGEFHVVGHHCANCGKLDHRTLQLQ